MSLSWRGDPSYNSTSSHLEILLTGAETALFGFLLSFVKEKKLSVEVRVAGGWVRDKLLERDCQDIDIALDTMTGLSFLESFKTWCQSSKGIRLPIGVIKPNPDKSKHLETATTVFEGLSIDFVNLRTEKYQSDSRIPQEVNFGTPLEDARRRDFTVNALFYNLKEKKIEDYLEIGLNNLKERLLRTPLPAWQTLREDPLRLLRGIRFAVVLGFTLDQDFIEASKDPTIHSQLLNAVSKERVNIEMQKIILAGKLSVALNFLFNVSGVGKLLFPVDEKRYGPNWYDFGIHNVQRLEENTEIKVDSDEDSESCYSPPCHCSSKKHLLDEFEYRSLMLAGFLQPLYEGTTDKKTRDSVTIILADCLRCPRKLIFNVKKILNQRFLWKEYNDAQGIQEKRSFWEKHCHLDKDFVGNSQVQHAYLLRVMGETWKASLILFLYDIGGSSSLNEDVFWNYLQQCSRFINTKPIVTGVQIKSSFRIDPSKPEIIREILNYQIQLLISSNLSLDKDAILERLEEHFSDLALKSSQPPIVERL